MKKARRPDLEQEIERMFWYAIYCYVADTVGLLDNDDKLKLAHLAEQSGLELPWRDQVREAVCVDDEFVKAVYQACLDCGRTRPQAVWFICRGIGCPFIVPEELGKLL